MRTKGLMVIAGPLIALVLVTSASLVLEHSERQERGVSLAANNLTKTANQVRADAVNAETGVRGYAATGDPLFLDPYYLALRRIDPDRKLLGEAAVAEGDSRQQQAVDATAATAFAELSRLRSSIAARVSLSNLRPGLERGKMTMDLLRRQVASLAYGPTAVAVAQHGVITRLESTIDALNIAGLVLGLLAGLLGVALFTSGVSRRVAMNAANAKLLGEGKPLNPTADAADEIGRVADSLAQAEDLLARRAADLVAARDQALIATQAKTAFLSNTSHELRTPLNSILGFTQLLEMSDLGDEDRDCVQRILGAGRHLLALINELIDIARIESGELSLSVEPVSVLALIEETSHLLAPLAAERSIAIVQYCTHPGLTANADRQRLSQILMNLISNAIKYNHRGGTITITSQEAGAGQVSVTVSDTGPGIQQEDLDRIFIPFERLGAELTPIEGTGIGLPLAKALTETMGGGLTASSVIGEGSAFTVSLPRAPDMIGTPISGPAPPSPARPARYRGSAGDVTNILYMEDNPANVEVISRYLNARPNARLTSVTSGQAGLECAIRDVPDVILLDLHLPGLRGDQVLEKLSAQPRTADIPVVVLSADAAPGVIRRTLALGARAYLTKPLVLAELGDLLDSFAASAPDPQAGSPTPATPA
ncbi:MAG TPA: ATP-binding protein [Streptosporangiaceae bacterium]|jgi:signal transduction histidine kinase/ActR/RegA family two-component response regulator|nr:ATP-binding protein [Streptosporangiaceae bacterium]